MKLATTARIEKIAINAKQPEIQSGQMLGLEFSAIDTGGGFHDSMIDFSFSIILIDSQDIDEEEYEITMFISDPVKEDNYTTFGYSGLLQLTTENKLEGSGRLHEDKISDDLMAFVMKRLR